MDQPSGDSDLDLRLAVAGLRPPGYSSKIKVVLEADSVAVDATRAILGDLFETMRINEDGTRRDLDSEFLHDFRVSVRRTRSALGQIKRVFLRERIDPFGKEFSWLGTLTGPTRDLDVFLIKLGDYGAPVPEATRSELEPLEAFLVQRQELEQAKVREGLGSDRYLKLKEDWSVFLSTEDRSAEGDRARKPAIQVASRCIRRAHKRVIRRGSAITPESHPGKLHRLRIKCKKLRYLLEFFRTLYPAEEIGGLVRALKRLQNNLGDFNDYRVHQTMLESFTEEMIAEGSAPQPTVDAIGLMLEGLARGEAGERENFAKRFEEFSAPATAAVFEKLFARPRVG